MIRCVSGERGQAVIAALGAAFALVVVILAVGMAGAAAVAKGRAQRAADLAAISAATVLDENRWRVALEPVLPDGSPNPEWLSRVRLGRMAREAAKEAGRRNGIPPSVLAARLIRFRDWVPSRVRVTVEAQAVLPDGEDPPVSAEAVAEAVPGSAGDGSAAAASGGGYSGPLAMRQGEGMRPDVARAFDRMAAAAARAGFPLAVTSGYRSDAEQAVLFAQHPDPRWVAPPGHSLHRCATELDLGPPSAYDWLEANAGRLGFQRRYAWEPWHFGYTAGQAPCSAPSAGAVRPGERFANALPAWVPATYRPAILRSAAANGISARLLAAQLSAESGFNPRAISPAGAQGIAQFIPATARSVGLADPFDPEQAINAQGRLMAQLIRQFRSPTLALAAYNAGPAAVAACGCVPPNPETRAYVAQISGLLGGGRPETAAWLPAASVRLVA